MKAIVVREFGAPEQMHFEEVSDLEPNENEILVRVRAAGVNPVDTYIRQGIHAQKPTWTELKKPSFSKLLKG